MDFAGIALDIEDNPDGGVAKIVAREIRDSYGLADLGLQPGDVVVDIGAHVGVVSVFMAKRYPGIRLLCYEPVPENFERLARNLQANGVTASAFNYGVSGDGRDLVIRGDLAMNSGGSGAFVDGDIICIAPTVTLRDIFEEHEIDRVALLKIDCEGAEYEILRASEDLLGRIDRLRGEFHSREDVAAVDLETWCKERMPDVVVTTA